MVGQRPASLGRVSLELQRAWRDRRRYAGGPVLIIKRLAVCGCRSAGVQWRPISQGRDNPGIRFPDTELGCLWRRNRGLFGNGLRNRDRSDSVVLSTESRNYCLLDDALFGYRSSNSPVNHIVWAEGWSVCRSRSGVLRIISLAVVMTRMVSKLGAGAIPQRFVDITI